MCSHLPGPWGRPTSVCREMWLRGGPCESSPGLSVSLLELLGNLCRHISSGAKRALRETFPPGGSIERFGGFVSVCVWGGGNNSVQYKSRKISEKNLN